MSKLNCSNCKYYDFNACDGIDWCKLNHEETGICGYCDREFEDLEEATTHYDALVEENNTFLMENSKMAGEIKDLQSQLAITEKALELACREITGSCEYCSYKTRIECPVEADCLDEKINYFKSQAKEIINGYKQDD